MGRQVNRLVRSLVSTQLDLERKQEAWATADRQARSQALVGKLASLSACLKFAQNVKQDLIQHSNALMQALQGLQQVVPHLEEPLKSLQGFQQQIQQWDQTAYRGWEQQQMSPGVGQNVQHYMMNYPRQQSSRLLEIAEKALGIVQAAKQDDSRIQRVAAQIRKLAQPQGQIQQRMFQNQISALQRLVNQGQEHIKALQKAHATDPTAQAIAQGYGQFMSYLSDRVESWSAQQSQPTASVLVEAAAKAQKFLRQAAVFLSRQRVATSEKNEIIKKLAEVDRGLDSWNVTRLVAASRKAQNGLFLAIRKLEASQKKSVALNYSPILREAWHQLEALDDMSQGEGDGEDLIKDIEDSDPEELSEALSDKLGSVREAKGKKKIKKKTPKRKTKRTKKRKKNPAISDDPWSGKKQTFDSAYKKVDHARSQLTKLMAKLAEASLVRGDVRYALSMLEKVLEAMRRC